MKSFDQLGQAAHDAWHRTARKQRWRELRERDLHDPQAGEVPPYSEVAPEERERWVAVAMQVAAEINSVY